MVHLQDVRVTYPGGLEALSPVSLRFERAEFTVLLGRSGAGKSTLLRTLNLLVVPTAGRVTADGRGSLRNPAALRAHRRDTAMIFQQHQLLGRQTALQNVLLGRLGHHPAWRTLLPLPRADHLLALRCLERVGLAERALTRVDRLSGGQQQRVGIARALAQQPRLILADEPVASLDPATANAVLRTLRAVCTQDGIPAVVSLHQLDLATGYADRIIGLSGGRIVFDGPPGALHRDHLATIYGDPPVAAPAAPLPRRPVAEAATILEATA